MHDKAVPSFKLRKSHTYNHDLNFILSLFSRHSTISYIGAKKIGPIYSLVFENAILEKLIDSIQFLKAHERPILLNPYIANYIVGGYGLIFYGRSGMVGNKVI